MKSVHQDGDGGSELRSCLSRAVTYSMLRAGVLQSILLTYPGCVKGLRLIDGDSLDRYLDRLAKALSEA
jgi:hypothetical protein